MVQKFRLELGHEVGLFAPAFLIGVALVKSGNAEVRVQADTALGEVPNLALQMLTFMTLGPEGHERQHLERQVRHFTKCRVRLDSDFCVATFDQGNPDQKRRSKKANFMAKLQAELLHHENWDGTPRT